MPGGDAMRRARLLCRRLARRFDRTARAVNECCAHLEYRCGAAFVYRRRWLDIVLRRRFRRYLPKWFFADADTVCGR